MKKKIFSILFALVLVLTLGLVTAVPAGADESDALNDWSMTAHQSGGTDGFDVDISFSMSDDSFTWTFDADTEDPDAISNLNTVGNSVNLQLDGDGSDDWFYVLYADGSYMRIECEYPWDWLEENGDIADLGVSVSAEESGHVVWTIPNSLATDGTVKMMGSQPFGYNFLSPAGTVYADRGYEPAEVTNYDTHTGYQTIQAAVTDALPGDTIIVAAGTYDEDVTITTSLQLLGAKAGVPAGPDASPANRGAPGEESIIDGRIIITGVSVSTIDGFTILSGDLHGIDLTGGGDVIKNNIIEGSGTGPKWHGGIWSGGGGGNLITNNNIRNYVSGMMFDGGDTDPKCTISENYITNCSMVGIQTMGGWSNGHIFSNNLIEGNGSGIVLAQGEHQVSGNRILNNDGSGIYIWAGPKYFRTFGIQITQNTIERNAGTAIYLDGDDPSAVDNVAHFNNIVGNTDGVINNHTAVFDATNNWWGATNGPAPAGNGNAVSTNVAFEPWLLSPVEPGTGAVDLSAIVPVPPEEQIGIRVDQTSISFGSITPGDASQPRTVTVTNTGNVDEDFSASLTNISTPDVYTEGLTIGNVGATGRVVSAWSVEEVAEQASVEQDLVLFVSSGTAPGTYRATLVFWAEAH